MGTRLDRRFWIGAAAVVLTLSAWLSFGAGLTGDYDSPLCRLCDDPAPSMRALVHGHVGDFFSLQPMMGPVSLIVRLPAAALIAVVDGSAVDEYRATTFLCLLVAGLGAAWIVRAAWGSGVARATVVLLALLLGSAIGWSFGIDRGHPEEALAAVLAGMAVVAAFRHQALAAGVLLGLAIATKEWALLAAPPVLLMCDRDAARRAGVAALLVCVLLFGAMAAGDPSAFWSVHQDRVALERTGTPTNIWWPLMTERSDGVPIPPEWVNHYSIQGVFALSLLLAALYAYRRRQGRAPEDALALFALVVLLRLLGDDGTHSYHHIPLLVAIPVWEVFALRRLPVVGLLTAVLLQLTARELARVDDADFFNLGYLAWTLPLLAYLVRATFWKPGPRQASRPAPAAVPARPGSATPC